jgi:hypothetical protein
VLQRAATTLGGSPLLDLHVKDLGNRSHPSHYDYTSVYDLVIFRRLATEAEVRAELGEAQLAKDTALASFSHIRTRPVASWCSTGCWSRCTGGLLRGPHLHRALPAGRGPERTAQRLRRSRLPASAADLMLRMLNLMVDSYLELRKVLSTELDHWQQGLLAPRQRGDATGAR